MKFRNLAINLFVATLALFIGLGLVSVVRYIAGYLVETKQHIAEKHPLIKENHASLKFDINDPNSVLPIDYDEDQLSDPHEDEKNSSFFDPEGSYYLDESSSEESNDFRYFDIYNKNFDVSVKDARYGELVAPSGRLFAGDGSKPFSITSISISNGKMRFATESINGVAYEFSGEFLIQGNFYTLDPNAKVLRGTLTKKKNGVSSISKELYFGWTIDEGC